MTCPPGWVNFTELETRFSTIWRIERASATTGGRSVASEERTTMRSRFACGCMIAMHCCTISFSDTLVKARSSLPASILERSRRSLISEIRCSPEEWMSRR